jgi:hypothetical protein
MPSGSLPSFDIEYKEAISVYADIGIMKLDIKAQIFCFSESSISKILHLMSDNVSFNIEAPRNEESLISLKL